MKSILTKGIVLTRTDFGEADRILTVLTPDHGKLRLMAKGVRKSNSKLAGGIELFGVSEISFIKGRGEVDTLVSTRLQEHFPHIVKDINRTMLGYELLKRLNRATEDATGEEYFLLLQAVLEGLNETKLSSELLESWFSAQLIGLGGHQPELSKDVAGSKLESDKLYAFDFDNMGFIARSDGTFAPNHIKLLRLLFGMNSPVPLAKLKNTDDTLPLVQRLITTIVSNFIKL